MKSVEVLKLLNITRVTLSSYVKSGKIKVTRKGNGYYNYDEESVYSFLNIEKPKTERSNIIYCRVSTYKQKNDLANQITNIINYCNENNIKYNKIYNEIASGINFDRKEFSILVNDVINNKINNIYITNKDRISRLSFITLENMFKKFGTNIVVINDIDKHISYEDELFEELINIIHLYSTKMYSS
jgi:predicted site-specific integrase-resolvase